MLIKQKDDVQPTLNGLEGFLASKTPSGTQRERIEEELHNVRAGVKGEKDAAYHIDFKLKDTKNWAVIHDLRLEHNGRVAQIDHLVIDRRFDIFVIESKSVKTALRVNQDGEFEVKTRWGWKGMPSPIEQNKRHIRVLSNLIKDEKLTPTRLGLQIRPTYRNWVLIPPECNLSKEKREDATILKMDMFDRGLEEHINDGSLSEMLSLAKICSSETIMEFAKKLVSFHRPLSFDYAAKFGITDAQRCTAPTPVHVEVTKPLVARPTCKKCHVSVEDKVVVFCRSNEKRFAGKILCRTCQSAPATKIVAPEPPVTVSGALCNQCASPVEPKVVAFCRFNSHRFGKQILCRTCQATVVALS